ncbi:hypothetical protein [Flavobacterium sp. FlaQc-48]
MIDNDNANNTGITADLQPVNTKHIYLNNATNGYYGTPYNN